MFVILESVCYEFSDRFVSLYADKENAILACMTYAKDFFWDENEFISLDQLEKGSDIVWKMSQRDHILTVRKVTVNQ